jgi:hypothetical protein
MTARKKQKPPSTGTRRGPVWRKAKEAAAPKGNKLGVRRWLLSRGILILPYGIELGDHLLISTIGPRGTLAIDLGRWPPRYRRIWKTTTSRANLAPDGNWLLCADKPGSGLQPDQLVIHEPGAPGPPLHVLDGPEGRTRGISHALTIGDQVIAIAGVYPYLSCDLAYRLEGTTLRPAADLPSEPAAWDSGRGARHFTHARVTIGDGTDVLIWSGNGYELRDGKFVRAWELNCTDQHVVPFGQDGLFFLRDRVIHQIRRRRRASVACPDADDVLGIWPGPQHSVLMNQSYRNRRSVEARVWFPDEGSFVFLHAKPELSDVSDGVYGSLHWSEKTQHLYVIHDDYLLTIPGDTLLARRRFRPKAAAH